MDANQKINCTVKTCRFNDVQRQECSLDRIVVEAEADKVVKSKEGSMCASYKLERNEKIL